MSAEGVFQAALLVALRGDAALAAGLNGVFEGPAVKASVPYAEVGELLSIDWGTKSHAGRELRMAVTVRDAGAGAGRAQGLAGAVGAAIEAMSRDLAGWRVASVVLLRTRVLRAGPGLWGVVVEYRVRMMAV